VGFDTAPEYCALARNRIMRGERVDASRRMDNLFIREQGRRYCP